VRVAVKLDPELSAAHCTLGYIKTVRELDWTGAEQEFKRALELSPSNADALDLYGRLCSALGRHDEAIGLVERARELDPLAHRMDVATTLLRAGRHDDALGLARDAVELDPEHDRAAATLGWAYLLGGRHADGLKQLEHAVSLSPKNTMWLGQLGAAYGLAGTPAKAKQILKDMEARAKSAYVSPYHFAYAYIGVGDSERAMDFLERAVSERGGAAYGIKSSFLLEPLRAHPRFRALLRTMKLE
jgi:serine/threonine-protein kinase